MKVKEPNEYYLIDLEPCRVSGVPGEEGVGGISILRERHQNEDLVEARTLGPWV